MNGPLQNLSLAADFDPADRAEWRKLVSGVLAKSGVSADADPEAALATATYDGFELAPLYTAEDVPSTAAGGLPGRSPFVRGSEKSGSAVGGWDVRQRHTDADPRRLNAALLNDLENGVTSLWLTVGDGGLAVADLATALDGVYLDLAPIALDAGSDTVAAAEALIKVASDRAVADADLRGSLGADPIGLRARTGDEIGLTVLPRLAALTASSPQVRVATVDGAVYHNAGASDSDELAIAASVGVAYLRALTDGGAGHDGVDIDTALALIEFRFAVTANQFNSIAKLRAARLIWGRIAELAGGSEAAAAQRQHAVTSSAMMTRRDPWVNMLRTTIGCFAAAVGGAQAITVQPFDSAIGVSDDFARRIARNTQSVLHDESSLARVIDPAGGSFYIESITEQLADAAWAKFTEIERAGGAVAALTSGHIPNLIAATRARRDEAIAHRTDPITGVSEFAFIGEAPVTRDPLPEPAASTPAAAGAGGQPVLPVIRYAEPFEDLRDRSDRHAESTGARPKVFLAALGPVSAHSGRVGFASNLFQAGGLEPVEGAGSIEELATAFTASGSSVACLCSSDKVYADGDAGAAAAAKALKAAGARRVWLAGQPGDRAESDAAAGVDGYLFVSCDALDALRTTLTDLEVV